MARTTLNVNGADRGVDAQPDSGLLYALRDDLKLRGPKFGCRLGECGACTVVMDGTAIRSCVTPVSAIGKARILTLEGLGNAGVRLRQTPFRPERVKSAMT